MYLNEGDHMPCGQVKKEGQSPDSGVRKRVKTMMAVEVAAMVSRLKACEPSRETCKWLALKWQLTGTIMLTQIFSACHLPT